MSHNRHNNGRDLSNCMDDEYDPADVERLRQWHIAKSALDSVSQFAPTSSSDLPSDALSLALERMHDAEEAFLSRCDTRPPKKRRTRNGRHKAASNPLQETPQSNLPTETVALTEFRKFPDLPPELRARIIFYAMQIRSESRTFVVDLMLATKFKKGSNDPVDDKRIRFEICLYDKRSDNHWEDLFDSRLFEVSREVRGEALRTTPYLLPTEYSEYRFKSHLGPKDSLSICNVEEALHLWSSLAPFPVHAHPSARYELQTRSDMQGEWGFFKGLRSLTLPSSILRFLVNCPSLSTFLCDLPALEVLKLLMQRNSERDPNNRLVNLRPYTVPTVVMAETDQVTHNFVSSLALMKQASCLLDEEEVRIRDHVITMLENMDRDRVTIQYKLTIYSGSNFVFPKMVLYGFQNWKAEVVRHSV